MRHLSLALACLLVPATASADGVYRRETETRREVEARVRPCGGDAFSFAEVAEGPLASGGGPVVSVPQTLCADLEPQRSSGVGPVAIYPNLSVGAPSGPSGDPKLDRWSWGEGSGGGVRPYRPHISRD